MRARIDAVLVCLLALAGAAGCAPARFVAPGAENLPAGQASWIVTHDSIHILSLDAQKGGYQPALDSFIDGVRSVVQVSPGVHQVEVIYSQDGGPRAVASTTLTIAVKTDKTYYVKNDAWGGVRYSVREYDGAPDASLMAEFKRTALQRSQ